MIVDDVDEDHEAAVVGRLDEPLEPVGSTVTDLGRERADTVVAPVVGARRRRHRH